MSSFERHAGQRNTAPSKSHNQKGMRTALPKTDLQEIDPPPGNTVQPKSARDSMRPLHHRACQYQTTPAPSVVV